TLRFGSKPAVAAAIKNPTAAPTGAVIAKISQNKEVTSSFNRLPLRKSATRRPPEHTRERHSVARVQPSVHNERLPVDVARGVAAQPGDRLGDLLRRGDVSGRQGVHRAPLDQAPVFASVEARRIRIAQPGISPIPSNP